MPSNHPVEKAFSIPREYYAKEGIVSIMGLGYTAALATVGLSLVGLIQKRDLGTAVALVGGCMATWGYLTTSGVEY
jgi:hypothetical protein